jgi:hypothetical protein
MHKKSLTVAMFLVLLLALAGSAFSGGGPGPYSYGPIVVLGHPWGENDRVRPNPPSYYPGSTEGGYSNLFLAPSLTNFVVEFYTRYVVKQQTDSQSIIRRYGRSE